MARNTYKIIEERRLNCNDYYQLTTKEIYEIVERCCPNGPNHDTFDLIVDSFLYGYEMGRRATLSEIKNKNKKKRNQLK